MTPGAPGRSAPEQGRQEPCPRAEGGEPGNASQAGPGEPPASGFALGGSEGPEQQHRVQVDVRVQPGEGQVLRCV